MLCGATFRQSIAGGRPSYLSQFGVSISSLVGSVRASGHPSGRLPRRDGNSARNYAASWIVQPEGMPLLPDGQEFIPAAFTKVPVAETSFSQSV